MDKIEIPSFNTKKEEFKFLVENKNKLIAQKKNIFKKADGFSFSPIKNKEIGTIKAMGDANLSLAEEIAVKAIINTTNLLDSHGDVHLPGLWNKSLKENKMMMHVQEHRMYAFDKIISDGADLKAYTKKYTWKELGFNFEGETEALEFDSLVKRERNSYMFDQYVKGYVKNHSVGMRYVKLILAVNDEDWGAEYEAWEKYFPQIINSDTALDKGWFWAVKEAKAIEGSAVPLGSNYATPTINIEAVKDTSTKQNEAEKSLQEKKNYLLNLN